MRHRTYLLVVLLATLSLGVAHAEAKKRCGSHKCDTKLVVDGGKTMKWQSPRMAGEADQLRLTVNGREAFYEIVPRTGRCRAYAYRLGVTISLSDCGSRRIRVRITNTATKKRTVRVGYRVR